MNAKTVSVILFMIVLGASIVATCANTQERQRQLYADVEDHKKETDFEITKLSKKTDKTKDNVIVLQVDVTYIRESIDEIKEYIKGK